MTSSTDIAEGLKPCPFCGQQPYEHPQNSGESRAPRYAVWCDQGSGGCGSDGPERFTEAEAIAAWNTRPTPPADSAGEADLTSLKASYSNLFEHFQKMSNHAYAEKERAEALKARVAVLEARLTDMVNAADAKRKIWSAEMHSSKRDRMLSDNDAHQSRALSAARQALQVNP